MPTDPAEIDLLILLGSLAAGCLGALVGLGGGIVLVPMLTLVFGVDVKTAMGASLVAVIGTSTGAAALRGSSRLSNQRVGIALELAATLGAIAGAAMMTSRRANTAPSPPRPTTSRIPQPASRPCSSRAC
jgi:uncharacterized membrane protein YfcA